MSAIDQLLIREYRAKFKQRQKSEDQPSAAIQEEPTESTSPPPTSSQDQPGVQPPTVETTDMGTSEDRPRFQADNEDASASHPNTPELPLPESPQQEPPTPEPQTVKLPSTQSVTVTSPSTESVTVDPSTESATAEEASAGSAHLDSAGANLKNEFAPQWEVDRFQWPRLCSDLMDKIQADLNDVVKLLARKCTRGKNVLLMTSHARGAGRTTMTLSLARQAAPTGLKIALVDGDLAKPELSQRLGVSAEVGLEAVISGDESLAGACIRSVDEDLSLLPLVAAQDSETCRWKNLASAIGELAAHHDLVIIDAGPLSQELRHLAKNARSEFDMGALIIQDSRSATREQLQSVATRIHEANLWMAGVVENFAA